MEILRHKTPVAKFEPQKAQWFLVDATDKVLGRLSTRIANTLRGKNKPTFSPHVDCGDFVVVTHAEKVRLTGKKWTDKIYYHHSKYVSGLKAESAKDILRKNPERLFYEAVGGMLPKNRLSNQLMKKLKVYTGSAHPHEAQKPQELK